MKTHERLGPISRVLCFTYDAWIIGGGVEFIRGKTNIVPKDIDIVISYEHWREASRLIPEGAVANRFGGFKFTDGPLTVDTWCDDLGRLGAYYGYKPFLAFQPRFSKTLKIEWGL